MSSNNTIHKIQLSVKAHFGDAEQKFENVFEDDVFENDVFDFE